MILNDVVVAGDGPAALALAAACSQLGLQVCVVGAGSPWTATYGTWVDEVPTYREALATTSPIEVVVADRRIALDRDYGVFDNAALRACFTSAPVVAARVTGVRHHLWGSVVDTTDGPLRARLVVDATGAVPALLSPRRGADRAHAGPDQHGAGGQPEPAPRDRPTHLDAPDPVPRVDVGDAREHERQHA